MKTITLSCLVLSVVVYSALAATPYQLCKDKGTGAVEITNVAVPDCNAPPCVLKKGTNVSVSITFTTGKAMSELSNKVYGEIGGLDVPFPGFPADQEDICKLGVTCPTKAGGSYTEKVMLPVSTSYPAISVTVKWEIKSGSDMCACFEVPLKIES